MTDIHFALAIFGCVAIRIQSLVSVIIKNAIVHVLKHSDNSSNDLATVLHYPIVAKLLNSARNARRIERNSSDSHFSLKGRRYTVLLLIVTV
jgi:hypothetical protein